MKPKLLGKIACALLRSHAWRRPRKSEILDIATGEFFHVRICDRCHITRAVKSRKVAVEDSARMAAGFGEALNFTRQAVEFHDDKPSEIPTSGHAEGDLDIAGRKLKEGS